MRARTRAETSKPSRPAGFASAIARLPSSATHCIAGNYVSDVHGIGRVDQGAHVKVTFDSDFDPIAGIMKVDPVTRTATYRIDDDGGGNLEPLLDLTVLEAGSLALFVAGFNGRAGCYQYKVEITAPTDVPTPSDGVSLTGTVTEDGTGARINGATITILDGANAGRSTSTDANGEYRFDGLTSENANASAVASGYSQGSGGTFINGVNTLDFTLQRATSWSHTGLGNSVFDMPTYISRVQIVGTYGGRCQNFIVRIAGRLIVNEILGTCSFAIGTRYEGVHLTSGGVVEVTNASGVSWAFTEVR